jgi:hypothetical protein
LNEKGRRSAAVSELQKIFKRSDVNNLGKAPCSTPRVALKTKESSHPHRALWNNPAEGGSRSQGGAAMTGRIPGAADSLRFTVVRVPFRQGAPPHENQEADLSNHSTIHHGHPNRHPL